MSQRPALSRRLGEDEFRRWYWLKEELVAFCRSSGIPAGGAKPEITRRVAAHLSGRPLVTTARVARTGSMPPSFEPSTLIGEGWRCSPALGAFFKQQCGRGFRFDAVMRDFIHTQAGRTLAEAVDCWRNSRSATREIPTQLEYNRHMRDFFAQHPDASREQAIAAWWAKRSQRAKV